MTFDSWYMDEIPYNNKGKITLITTGSLYGAYLTSGSLVLAFQAQMSGQPTGPGGARTPRPFCRIPHTRTVVGHLNLFTQDY